MTKVLNHLAINYPNFESRRQIEELDLSNKGLSGELDFTHLGFTNLRKLILTNNQLSKIVLTNPQQITYLDISNNQLAHFDTSELSSVLLTFGEIKNNPLPLETKKDWIIRRWNYYKDLEVDWPELLVSQITKLVDIKDLDNFVLNYDFNREGEQEYHQIIGNGFTSLLDERALELLSQQVLARCLIKQNELVDGKNEEYELEINNLAHQFQRASEMFIKCPLKTIQKEVIRELAGEKDLVREFQNQLGELEMILRNGDESLQGVPDLEQIKSKIEDLHNTIQKQKGEIIQLRQTLLNKKQSYDELLKTGQEREEKLEFYADNIKIKERIVDDYKKEVDQLEQKIATLTLVEESEKVCRQRIIELEEKINITSKSLKSEFGTLLSQKDDYINQLEGALKQLKKNKKQVEDNLNKSRQTIDSLAKEKEKYQVFKQWGKYGLISSLVVGIIMGSLWIVRKIKG